MLDPADRADLLVAGRPFRARRGARIVIQGDHSDAVFVVLEGRVKVTVDTADGREVVLAVDGPGDLLGEFEAIDADGRARAAGTVALEPVSGRVLSGDEFRDYLGAHPATPVVLLRWMIRRLSAADRRRVDGTSLDTPHRLAGFLLELADRGGADGQGGVQIDIPLTQNELASLIGVSRNSVVRALATLRSLRLVTTARHTITIPDLDALRRFTG
jgi:CRP/FNR family transcriptional regulator, cyclic AMP receptor protein